MQSMNHFSQLHKFSLSGGPMHRLGRRLGLVRHETNSVAVGLALAALLWGMLVLLALAEGVIDRLFSLSIIGVHIRLLVAIPLLMVFESIIDPRMSTFVRGIVKSKILSPEELPRLESFIGRIHRLRDSWLPESVLLALAVLFTAFSSKVPLLHGASAQFDPSVIIGGMLLAERWYWLVCLTLLRFLLLRCIWWIFLWVFLLWRISRMELRLVPIHPDKAAGLGYLEVVHIHFFPLILAISSIQAAGFAEEIVAGARTLESIVPSVLLTLLVDAVLFLGPLFLFLPKLVICRVNGLAQYTDFAQQYASGFDRKWIGQEGEQEPLLGTSDIQSLADLNNSFDIVNSMRLAPISTRMLIELAITALIPMLPLLLFEYPFVELIEKFAARLTGL